MTAERVPTSIYCGSLEIAAFDGFPVVRPGDSLHHDDNNKPHPACDVVSVVVIAGRQVVHVHRVEIVGPLSVDHLEDDHER
jgi:hypothetical protein